MPRQRHKVQSLTAPLSSGSQAVRLATLRKRDAWDTNQQPLRFAHLPEMREQGGRATSTRCYRAQRLQAVFQNVGRPREVLSDRPPEHCDEGLCYHPTAISGVVHRGVGASMHWQCHRACHQFQSTCPSTMLPVYRKL